MSDEMTMRDRFAMAALQGLLACPNTMGDHAKFAKAAYQLAATMLAERSRLEPTRTAAEERADVVVRLRDVATAIEYRTLGTAPDSEDYKRASACWETLQKCADSFESGDHVGAAKKGG